MAGAVATAAIVFYGASSPNAPVAAPNIASSAVDQPITVHISGAVATPGLVEIPRDARVADAIAAAGGATGLADLSAINLADGLHDAQQIVVPSLAPGGAPVTNDGLIHLNRASALELEAIPGVGPVLAGRIIAARDEAGGFSAVEDLLDVSGIGEARLATFRDLVTVP